VRIEAFVDIEARARFAVGEHQPYFLAEVFIQAANDLKTNRIKLPCESTYAFDVNKYPPKQLTEDWVSRRAPAREPLRQRTCQRDAMWHLSSIRSKSTYT